MKKALAHLPAARPARAPFTLPFTLPARLGGGLALLGLLGGLGLLASRPAHTAGGPVPVTVANTVQNRDVDSEARQPVEVTVGVDSQPNQTAVFGLNVYTVPVGKRLVVESMSLIGGSPGSALSGLIRNSDSIGNNITFASLTTGRVIVGIGGITQPIRIHAEPGNVVTIDLYETGSPGVHASVSLSGYLVDVP